MAEGRVKGRCREQRREQRASELLELISNLGPAVIKGGQALASRPDLLPAEYLRKLQELQDRVPAFLANHRQPFVDLRQQTRAVIQGLLTP